MKWFRKLFGWLVVLVSWLGVLVCVVALAGVWILSHRVRGSVDRVVVKVTEFTSRIEDRSEEVAGRVGESKAKVVDLHRRLEEKVDAIAEKGGLDPAELKEVEEQVRVLAQRMRDWMEVAGSTREFVVLFGEILDSFGAVAGADGRDEVGAALTEGLGQVQEATGVLDELATALDEARENREEAGAGEKIESILTRFAKSLAVLEERTTAFADSVGTIGANPLFPALRSGPTAGSGAIRQPPFSRPPVQPDGWFRGHPSEANS